MPGDRAHKVSDHHALPPSGALSEEQFGQLMALLEDQHQALVAVLEPIRAVAAELLAEVLADRGRLAGLLADREGQPASSSDPAAPDNDGSGNES